MKEEDFAKNKRGIREEIPTTIRRPTMRARTRCRSQGQTQGKMEQKGKDPAKDINAKALMNEETLFEYP